MRIDTAQSEGADPRDTGHSPGPPGPGVGRNEEGRPIKPEMGVWLSEGGLRRDLPMTQGEHRLDEAGYAGRPFQVADIGFYRAQGEGSVRRPTRGEDRGQGPDLDGISEGGARAMGFHK